MIDYRKLYQDSLKIQSELVNVFVNFEQFKEDYEEFRNCLTRKITKKENHYGSSNYLDRIGKDEKAIQTSIDYYRIIIKCKGHECNFVWAASRAYK